MGPLSPKGLKSRLLDRFKISSSNGNSSLASLRDNHTRQSAADGRSPIPIFAVPLSAATIASRLDKVAPQQAAVVTGSSQSELSPWFRFWCPAIVIRCLDYLNAFGLEEEGLYRVPGSSETVRRLKVEYNCLGDFSLDSALPDDPNYNLQIGDVASLFKLYLRELPLPIISRDLAIDLEKNLTDTEYLRTALSSRTEPYDFYLLSILFHHLIAVAARSQQNKMDAHNLSILFCSSSNLGIGPNIFTAMLTPDLWSNLRCQRDAEVLQREQSVLNFGPSLTTTDQMAV